MTLRLGAVYDWLLALTILAVPEFLLSGLRFPQPRDPFLFRLSSLPLWLFPLVYLTAAADPGGRPWAVRVSIMFRIAGGTILGALALWLKPPGLQFYYILAALDVGWGLLHQALASGIKNPLAQGDANG